MLSADVVLTTVTLYCLFPESLPAVVCQSYQDRQSLYLLEVLKSTNVCIQLNSETILSAQSVSRPLDYCGALMCLLLSCAQARIKGSLKVFFYDTEAGVTQVEQVFARPRALAKSPYMLEVRLCMRQIGLPEFHFNAC